MKKFLLLTLLSSCFINANATNLYWVGDTTGLSITGLCNNSRWNNPNCWSLTSGGTIHPLAPPTSGDDVYFDNNWIHNRIIIGDTIPQCRNFYLQEGLWFDDFSTGFVGAIHIYGDLLVTSTNPNAESFLMVDLVFKNPVQAHISIPNSFMANLPNLSTGTIIIEDGCELILDSDYYQHPFYEVYVANGKFNLNGYRFRSARYTGGAGSVMDITNSTVYCDYIYCSASGLQLVSSSNGNIIMDLTGDGDNMLILMASSSTLNLDTVGVYNIPLNMGTERIVCDDCYINNLLVDSSWLAGFAVNGHIQNVSVTASELGGGFGYPYNLTVDVFNFEPYGYPFPYWFGSHSFSFSCNTTILDTFLLSNSTGNQIALSSKVGMLTYVNVDLGDEYCFDSLAVKGFVNTGLPLHIEIHGSDLGENINVLFDSCGYINYLVWPGDANSDSVVNALDMFSIGLYFGSTGPARDSISNLWIGHNASDWTGTQFNGSNYKHADCSGDGVVNFSDTIAVNLNYGLTRSANLLTQNRTGEPIYVVPDASTYLPGTMVTLEIWAGTVSAPLTNGYGLNYSVSIDQSAIEPGTLGVNYSGSWFGTKNTDMITLQRYNSGITNITQVRTDQNNVSGMGKIAEISFIANNSINSSTSFPVTVTAMDAIDNNGTNLTLTGIDTLIKIDPALNINSIENEVRVLIYPNPSRGIVEVISTTEIYGIEIFNVSGVRVTGIENIHVARKTLDFTHLESGMYSLKIKTANGISVQKVSLLR